LRWFSVGFFSLRCFFDFFLSNLDEDKMTLVLEVEEDSDPILRFELVRAEGGIVEGRCDVFAVGPPPRVLVPRPASLAQSSREELVDIRAAVSIGLDMVGCCLVCIVGRSWA
jgi:hypothetical protein